MNIAQIKQATKCCVSHLSEYTDKNYYTWAILDCRGCSYKPYCLKAKRVAEQGLNKPTLETTLCGRLIGIASSFRR